MPKPCLTAKASGGLKKRTETNKKIWKVFTTTLLEQVETIFGKKLYRWTTFCPFLCSGMLAQSMSYGSANVDVVNVKKYMIDSNRTLLLMFLPGDDPAHSKVGK